MSRRTTAKGFTLDGREYTVERYQNYLHGPHLRVTTAGIRGAVMARDIEPDSAPFFVGGYAIDRPALRYAIAAKVAELCDPPVKTT